MTAKKKRIFTAVISLTAVCILCGLFTLVFGPTLIMPGASRKTGTANIVVFEDFNGDGKQNSNEDPIANALIIIQSNIHGGFTRQTLLSDAQGKATLTGTYTHYFDVGVLAPCGYTATTPNSLSAAGAWFFSKQRFGFQSQIQPPSNTINSLHFQLWHDVNDDGQQQANEPSLSGVAFGLVPPLDFSYKYYGFDEDALALTTDENGQASLDVGNFCGDLWLKQPEGWLTTMTEPESIENDDMIRVTSQVGQTDITWGLHPEKPILASIPPGHHFEFGFGAAYHPEDFGAWQVSLESNGTFSVTHQVGDMTDSYGPVRLSSAEMRPLWGAILTANIPALPETFQRPGIPDETSYTFSLNDGTTTHTAEMWVDDADLYAGVSPLVELIGRMVETHTGQKME